MPHSASRGVTTLLVLGFMGVFLLVLGTLTSYVFQQAKYGRALYGREQALHIAEAGIEYYRWFLAHFPNNLTNGTGGAGPYTYTVNDPEGSAIGNASLTITGNTQCGVIQSIDITSRGTSNLNPSFPRTLFVRHMQKSVAAYSYLLNSNVWAGADRNITGPYFSNGGVRMDGTNNSDVSSGVSTVWCDGTSGSLGCDGVSPNPPSGWKNGVFGNGTSTALWSYPVATIDFAGIAVGLSSLKTYAQANGRYFAPAAGSVSSRGYHVIFKSDGTFDIHRVTSTLTVPGYSPITGWNLTEPSIINNKTFLGNYTIPSTCSVIFVEDRAWVEGVVSGKVTLAAATPSASTTTPEVYLLNNITYATNDGTSGLTVIGEGDVLLPLNVPSTMEIHGIFVAQSGRYGRNFYTNSSSYPANQRVGSSWAPYVLRTQLITQGTIVSNYRTGTAWVSGGSTISGFQSRIDAYDVLQAANPPPFTPVASTDYRFVIWREQ